MTNVDNKVQGDWKPNKKKMKDLIEYLKKRTDQDTRNFHLGDKKYNNRELVQELEQKTKVGRQIYNMYTHTNGKL